MDRVTLNHSVIAIDTNVLIQWVATPIGSDTWARLEHLLTEITARKGRIIVPTPALAEFFVRIDEAVAWFEALDRRRAIQVVSFDRRAALEHALMTNAASKAPKKKVTRLSERQLVKFDRQIVAIAKVAGASAVLSSDGDVRDLAKAWGIQGLTINDLPLPASARQGKLDLPLPGSDEQSTATPSLDTGTPPSDDKKDEGIPKSEASE